MNLKMALEIGKDCELETVGEAIYNIKSHVLQLFSPYDINKELAQLESEWDSVKNNTKFTDDSSTVEVLDWIKEAKKLFNPDFVLSEGINLEGASSMTVFE